MTLGNIRIGKKLALGFGFVVLVALILGAAGLFGISSISDDLAEVGTARVPDLRILTRLNTLRAVIRAEQQHAAVEPRAYGIPSGPDAIAPGKHFHAPILAVAGWFCHSVRLALSFEARCASL